MTWNKAGQVQSTVDVNNGQATQSFSQAKDAEFDVSVSGDYVTVAMPWYQDAYVSADGDRMEMDILEDYNTGTVSSGVTEVRLNPLYIGPSNSGDSVYVWVYYSDGNGNSTDLIDGQYVTSEQSVTTSWKQISGSAHFSTQIRSNETSTIYLVCGGTLEMRTPIADVTVDSITQA